MPAPIVHNSEDNRFEIHSEGGGEPAVLEYTIVGKHIDMHHTYVPQALRGQGIAAELVEAALVFAKHQGLEVIPSCSYVAKYLERH